MNVNHADAPTLRWASESSQREDCHQVNLRNLHFYPPSLKLRRQATLLQATAGRQTGLERAGELPSRPRSEDVPHCGQSAKIAWFSGLIRPNPGIENFGGLPGGAGRW